MAQGDVIFFEEATLALADGTHDLTTGTGNEFKLAILDNTTTPTASDVTPALADYTQVSAAGTYTAGGTVLTHSWNEAAGVATFDSSTNPTWAQHASNDIDAYWGLVYNNTNVGKEALCFVDLGGPVDMTAGDLTITWGANGVFTLTKV